MKRASVRLVVAAVVVAVVAGLQPAAAYPVVAVPGSSGTNYATPVVVIEQGEDLSFVNGDVEAHNVQALDAKRPDGSAPWCTGFPKGGCPLFWSDLVGFGEITPVLGLDAAPSGAEYTYFCVPHPWMKGTILVR